MAWAAAATALADGGPTGHPGGVDMDQSTATWAGAGPTNGEQTVGASRRVGREVTTPRVLGGTHDAAARMACAKASESSGSGTRRHKTLSPKSACRFGLPEATRWWCACAWVQVEASGASLVGPWSGSTKEEVGVEEKEEEEGGGQRPEVDRDHPRCGDRSSGYFREMTREA